MPKLKVALLILYPLHPEEPGGIPGGVWAVGYNMGRLLSAFDDLEVHVVHCQAGLSQDRVVQGEVSGGGLTVHYLAVARKPWRLTIQGAVTRMSAYLRELQPDVANAHAAQYAYAALRAGLPTVYTVHGVVRQEFRAARRLKQRLTLLLPMAYDTAAARRAAAMVAISPYVVRQYAHRTAAPFHRIEVPISPEFFEVAEMPRTPLLFTAGNLNERKDYLTMLQALVRVRQAAPDVELRIAGGGEAGYRATLEGFIAQHHLEPNVRFVGLLNRPGMVQAYAQCRAVLLSSRQETAPGIICEGMAAGRPVVATAVGGVGDMVAEGESGFVVPAGDAEALAERTLRLLTDDGLARRMGAAGHRRARERWWPGHVAEQYRQLLWDVARRAKGGEG
ncbi:MAG: glycosyltransferase family 4 protein [Chloroflexi bacterium]|nr:glycosyltransferase family 4 protein [Chloroflexota bacterium]